MKEDNMSGVFGIYSPQPSDVATDTYQALYALQHRGQETCGIAVNHQGDINVYKDLGLVPDVFNQEIIENLGQGQIAIGHVLYAKRPVKRSDAQPLVVRHIKGNMALAYNGALTNATELRESLELGGAIFQTENDSEVIAYEITSARLKTDAIESALEQAMYRIKGAYSLVLMSPKKLLAARDPQGFRPLSIGKMGDSILVASETCAFESVGAEFIRDIEPGEIVVIDENGIQSIRTHCGQKTAQCVFEFIYFARPDSVIDSSSIHEARLRAGAFLALEHPAQADVVIGVPDSGLDAALGFSRQSGIPYGVGFIKNRYVGRTFIQPTQKQREKAVRIKLNVLKATVDGKRVVLIDDSIVRGTTSKRIVNLLREAGAKEVHMRISSPPFMNPCFFGTDIASRDKLIACRMSLDEIAENIGVDSLGFLSINNVDKIAAGTKYNFCTGCFTGEYPIGVPDDDKFKCVGKEKPTNKKEEDLEEK